MKTALSHALAFALELALLAGLARVSLALIDGPLGYGAALALVALAVGLWGCFAAPKSPRRLTGAGMLIFKTGAFTLGALAILISDGPAVAATFAALAGLHLMLASRLGML